MKYIIQSQRVGTPGEEYIPAEGADLKWLLDAGFISTTEDESSSKVKSKKEPKE
jgi:hypothetical protein